MWREAPLTENPFTNEPYVLPAPEPVPFIPVVIPGHENSDGHAHTISCPSKSGYPSFAVDVREYTDDADWAWLRDPSYTSADNETEGNEWGLEFENNILCDGPTFT
jgi:hypothetical protein